MIQLRNVPEPVHRRLKARAALAGVSLSDYLLRELRKVAERPTPDEIRRRLATRAALPDLRPATAETVREERDTR